MHITLREVRSYRPNGDMMDDLIFMPIIIAMIGPVISGIFGLLILIQGRKTHQTFNSKMDRLLELTDTAAFARGQKDSDDKQKQGRLV